MTGLNSLAYYSANKSSQPQLDADDTIVIGIIDGCLSRRAFPTRPFDSVSFICCHCCAALFEFVVSVHHVLVDSFGCTGLFA